MSNNIDSLFLKILIVGDPGVGKTSILNQYCYKRFDENTRPTIGCDFSTIIHKKGQQIIRAQFWDIAGQEKFHSVSKMYVRGAHGCVIVCDITNEASLHSTLKWKQLIEIDSSENDGQAIPILLAQNKKDLSNEVTNEYMDLLKLEKFSQNNNFFGCFQTSAKTSEGLENAFEKIIDEIIKRKGSNLEERKKSKEIKLNYEKSLKKSQCC